MNMVIAMIQAGNLAVLVKTAGESMGLREAMYVFFPGFIAVSKSFVFVTTPPCLVKNILTVLFVSIIVKPSAYHLDKTKFAFLYHTEFI